MVCAGFHLDEKNVLTLPKPVLVGSLWHRTSTDTLFFVLVDETLSLSLHNIYPTVWLKKDDVA